MTDSLWSVRRVKKVKKGLIIFLLKQNICAQSLVCLTKEQKNPAHIIYSSLAYCYVTDMVTIWHKLKILSKRLCYTGPSLSCYIKIILIFTGTTDIYLCMCLFVCATL